MIAVVGTAAVDPIVASCAELDATERWTPLGAPAWLGSLPGPVGRFARRRPIGDRASPALLGVDAALRAWARDRTHRRYLSDFVLRAAIDVWTAREVERRRPRVVFASSLAARRTFAAARAIGAACVLVLDVPLLRVLHRDLDRAAEAWPERAFLRRFRAPSWAIARQEAERVLADLIVVRGAYARSLCIADGIAPARLARIPARTISATAPPPTGRLRLAGLAAARHGIDTALAAARALGRQLVVRTGEGTEPPDLLARAGVTSDAMPVDAIICPAICETYAPELHTTGLPVIASAMASLDGRGTDPYDAVAFAAAIASATAAEPLPAEPLAPRLAALG